ncbi:hypothetical protein BC833DRAFT_570319 [Globomyces pollinis-pini]|nr:hypothetical protein BC833DRAFT_570319 [Globomyces pollinis-pini]
MIWTIEIARYELDYTDLKVYSTSTMSNLISTNFNRIQYSDWFIDFGSVDGYYRIFSALDISIFVIVSFSMDFILKFHLLLLFQIVEEEYRVSQLRVSQLGTALNRLKIVILSVTLYFINPMLIHTINSIQWQMYYKWIMAATKYMRKSPDLARLAYLRDSAYVKLTLIVLKR